VNVELEKKFWFVVPKVVELKAEGCVVAANVLLLAQRGEIVPVAVLPASWLNSNHGFKFT
jgi:hypothetical protein